MISMMKRGRRRFGTVVDGFEGSEEVVCSA